MSNLLSPLHLLSPFEFVVRRQSLLNTTCGIISHSGTFYSIQSHTPSYLLTLVSLTESLAMYESLILTLDYSHLSTAFGINCSSGEGGEYCSESMISHQMMNYACICLYIMACRVNNKFSVWVTILRQFSFSLRSHLLTLHYHLSPSLFFLSLTWCEVSQPLPVSSRTSSIHLGADGV